MNVFDHISIGMERMADAPAVLAGVLGGVPDAGASSTWFRWGCWRFDGGGLIEIIEPRGQDGFLHRFLARHGPGIHHVTVKVPNLRDACSCAEAQGYTILGYDDSNPNWKEAFLHPKQALGIVVQLAEASGEEDIVKRWQPPAGPDNPPPVTIVGLRTRAASRERGELQWGRVLGGEGGEGDAGELVYRWRDSPMRIAVEIDPASDEGPVCIEIATDRPVVIPTELQALIGARFARAGSAYVSRQPFA